MNYTGLDPIMREITFIVSEEKDHRREAQIYALFSAVEKYVRTAVPQLFRDMLEQYSNTLTLEFKTILNGKVVDDATLTAEIARVIQETIPRIL